MLHTINRIWKCILWCSVYFKQWGCVHKSIVWCLTSHANIHSITNIVSNAFIASVVIIFIVDALRILVFVIMACTTLYIWQ